METGRIIGMFITILGTCVGGFFFLALWIRGLAKETADLKIKLKDKVDFDWFEKVFKPELMKDLKDLEVEMVSNTKQIRGDIKEISDSIVGSVSSKGMLTKMHEHDDRIKRLER